MSGEAGDLSCVAERWPGWSITHSPDGCRAVRKAMLDPDQIGTLPAELEARTAARLEDALRRQTRWGPGWET